MIRKASRISRGILVPVLCCILLLLFPEIASGETQIRIEQDEWTWEAGGISLFHGSILPDRDVSAARIILSVETRLDESGEAVFTSVDGTKLKIRKRAAEITADLNANQEFFFEGQWRLPEDTGSGIGRAVLRISILDPQGKEIASGRLEAGSREEEEAVTGVPLTRKIDRLILGFGISGLVIWAAAIVRYIIIQKKNRKEF